MPNTYYVIREIGTEKYIPLPKKLGCGYTQVEPSDSPNDVPRLFTSVESARMSLREWLKGFQYNEWDQDAYIGPFVKTVPTRVKDKMEIIPIEIRY